MKILLTLILTLFSSWNVFAMCAWDGLYVFPKGKTLLQHSILVLEGYGGSQDVITGLNKKHFAYLVSGDKKVKLNVKEILVGQFMLTQAVLVPETGLQVGLSYTLEIENLPEDQSLTRWNDTLSKHEPIRFNIVQGVDKIAPVFKALPKETKKALQHYGCGPSIHVIFSCNVIEGSEYLVKATVKSMDSSTTTSYYLLPEKGTVSIGHGMCSGAFSFDKGDDYEVVFELMDALGNTTSLVEKGTETPIKFTKPNGFNTKED